MDEREKLESAVAARAAARAAADERERRDAYEYAQKQSANFHELREKLREIAAAFAPKVIVSFSEDSNRAIDIDIGDGRWWLRKPFASMQVWIGHNGFRVTEWYADSNLDDPRDTIELDSVEQVSAIIRNAGAAYVDAGGEYTRHRPEWLHALVYLNAGLAVVAIFALCVLIWGWNGTAYGALAGWVAFLAVRALGGWGVVITAGIILSIVAEIQR